MEGELHVEASGRQGARSFSLRMKSNHTTAGGSAGSVSPAPCLVPEEGFASWLQSPRARPAAVHPIIPSFFESTRKLLFFYEEITVPASAKQPTPKLRDVEQPSFYFAQDFGDGKAGRVRQGGPHSESLVLLPSRRWLTLGCRRSARRWTSEMAPHRLPREAGSPWGWWPERLQRPLQHAGLGAAGLQTRHPVSSRRLQSKRPRARASPDLTLEVTQCRFCFILWGTSSSPTSA